jgi:hypothetical protein
MTIDSRTLDNTTRSRPADGSKTFGDTSSTVKYGHYRSSMSLRLSKWHLSRSIGICIAARPVVFVTSTQGGIYRVRRSVSQQARPRRSSLQLDRGLWGLSQITRKVRKYLAGGDNYVSILKGNPNEGSVVPFQ